MALASACDGDGEPNGQATPTSPSPPDSTATSQIATAQEPTTADQPTPSDPTPPPDIRQEDLTQQQPLQEFLGTKGGEVDPASTFYADLTGNGADEAIVPVSSGGTLGDIAVFVFGYHGGQLTVLLTGVPTQSASIRAVLAEGQLVIEEPILGPDDPLCCPSEVLRRYYLWDGSSLVVDREEQVAAP